MNKLLSYILLLCIVAFAACKKDDAHPFDKSPNDRVDELLTQYQAAIVGAQYGWRAVVSPDSGKSGGYTFYFKFTDANRVTMLSDIYPNLLTQSFESSYRLKWLQQPALIFDTYSYLHVLSDPSTGVNGGTPGKGLMSDFEFAIDTVTTDSIKLTGRFNGSRAYMVHATQQESEDFAAGFEDAMAFENINNLTTYFKRLVLGTNQYDISIDPQTRIVTLSWVEGNTVHTFSTGYYYTAAGVVFKTPFVNGNVTINGFTNIVYDPAKSEITVTANGTAGTITGTGKPLQVDVNAPQRWYQTVLSQGSYWYSWSGFTVEGQVDAFGITTIPNYYYLIFWPEFGADYDLLGFVVVNNNSLALAFGIGNETPPQFTSDGRVIFSPTSYRGTIPPEDQDKVDNTAIQFGEPAGYYLVQTGRQSYDMVSAKDGKAWISWQY